MNIEDKRYNTCEICKKERYLRFGRVCGNCYKNSQVWVQNLIRNTDNQPDNELLTEKWEKE